MEIEAAATNLTVADVPEDELWDFSEFRDYRVKLLNNSAQTEIVNFQEWKSRKEQ